MVVIRPDNDIGYGLQANALMYENKWEDALDSWNRAIAVPPEDAGEYFHRARTLYIMGDAASAMSDMRKVLVMETPEVKHLRLLGPIQSQLGQHEEAITTFTQLIALAPGEPDYYSYRAAGYRELKQYRRAISDLHVVLRSSPTVLDILLRISTCYAWSGDLEKSLEFLDEAVKHHPDDSDAWEIRGERHLLMGHLPGSEA